MTAASFLPNMTNKKTEKGLDMTEDRKNNNNNNNNEGFLTHPPRTLILPPTRTRGDIDTAIKYFHCSVYFAIYLLISYHFMVKTRDNFSKTLYAQRLISPIGLGERPEIAFLRSANEIQSFAI